MYKHKYKIYNATNKCDNCEIEKLRPGDARREYDDNTNWTGRWLCEKCVGKHRQKLSNSQNNIKKSLANRRTGNLDPNTNCAKGDKFEKLTCKWRNIENLNIENNDYNCPIDHSRDPELGIIQTKGKLYDPIDRCWRGGWRNEHNKEFDNLIYYCASKDGKKIERIYIFPKEEINKRSTIAIYKNPSKGGWYQIYRVDEKICNHVNNIFQKLGG